MANWHWHLGWLISLLWLPVAAAEPDTAPPASLAELSYLTEQYKPYNYQAAVSPPRVWPSSCCIASGGRPVLPSNRSRCCLGPAPTTN